MKYLVIGLVLGILTVVTCFLTVTFITQQLNQSTISTSGGAFSNINATVVIILYGVATLILGSLFEKMFGKKKKK